MLRVLHLEDQDDDAYLIERAIAVAKIEANFTRVKNRSEYLAALERAGFDLILADNALPGFDGMEALEIARQKAPEVAFIAVSGGATEERASAMLKAGASNFVSKDRQWELIAALRAEQERLRLRSQCRGMSRLVRAVQELSLARDLESIIAVVRRAARELTGADGATFIVKEGDLCHYAEENAIGPLWKGQRFPMQRCVSGWAMLNRQPAVIEDIYSDARIPVDAYRPTFVKSLAMVPIRTEAPIGAIGNYWARQRRPTSEEVELLQALANTTAVAIENVRVYNELEQRVKDRTAALEATNREMESFSYSVSHDLAAPLRSVRAFSEILLDESANRLTEEDKRHLGIIRDSGLRMSRLIEDLLKLSRLSRAPLRRTQVDVSQMAKEIIEQLSAGAPERKVDVMIKEGLAVKADAGLLQGALENLLSNAWKYTSKTAEAQIEIGSTAEVDGRVVYFVRDNGAGFEMQYAQNLFLPFQRFHSEAEFPGSGIGLATVKRIIQRHGGRIWAEAEVNKGATIYFTLEE